MKFSFAALVLLVTSTEATKLKTQAQMESEIKSMSMNHQMHQVAHRQKTLLKSYLEVDLNEFLQNKMDTELFEGVDEQQKAEFVGNFFHFVKCRFQDCNTLAQTKSSSKQPTVADTNTREKAQDLADWGSGKGIHTQAYHSPEEVQYTQTGQPTVAETVTREDAQDLKDWGSGKGTHTQAYHSPEEVQYVGTAEKNKKDKITTNAYPEILKEQAKEKAQELVTPSAKADNSKDSEPKDDSNVQIKNDKKAEKKTEAKKEEKKTEKKEEKKTEKKEEKKAEVKK